MEYVYSAMLLHSMGQKVEENAVKKVIQAAGGKPDDGKVRALVTALESVDIEKAIKEATLPVAAAPVAAPAAGHEAKAEKKEEKKDEEAAAAGLGSLFG